MNIRIYITRNEITEIPVDIECDYTPARSAANDDGPEAENLRAYVAEIIEVRPGLVLFTCGEEIALKRDEETSALEAVQAERDGVFAI